MRTQPSISELDALVVAECEKNISNADMFTAYGVTLELRKANLDIEIDHHEVRSLVQAYMSGLTNYTSNTSTWNGSQATTYVPQMAQAQVASPTQTVIPANTNPLAQLLATTPAVGMVIDMDDEDEDES